MRAGRHRHALAGGGAHRVRPRAGGGVPGHGAGACPLIRLPHGAGHIKLSREADTGDRAARAPSAGSGPATTWNGRVVPAAFAVAHQEDRDTLAWSCPEALPVTEVVGDSCYDRIAASLRGARTTGAPWASAAAEAGAGGLDLGLGSAFNRLDALLPRLLTELPRESGYRVAVLVHPNVWAGHGHRQVHAWLSVCRGHGVTLLPPRADWRAALISADAIIGDHGSVTLYGTMTKAPILLARVPDRDINPPLPARRSRAAPRAHRPTRSRTNSPTRRPSTRHRSTRGSPPGSRPSRGGSTATCGG
ncbi:hypothetical protein NKH77_35265 [Streptomyces sp. M19]